MKTKLGPRDYLSKAKYNGSIEDYCGNFYRLFLRDESNKKKRLESFVMLLEWSGESDESVEIDELFNEDDYRKTCSSVSPVIKKIVDNLADECLDETAFYTAILEKISDDVLFSNELEKICAIVMLLFNPKIPYFKLEQTLKMDNEKFQEISKSIQRDITKAFFVIQFGYSQKTEIASQLYSIVNKHNDETERIVLIANIIGYYTFQIKMLKNKLNEKNNIEESDE